MKLVQGIHHHQKRALEDYLITAFQAAIVAIILFIIALVGVDAWTREDIARVEKLKRHFYEVALQRGTVGPAVPTGVKPNYGDLSEPRTKVFQDASSGPRKVK